jgi:hypothetical protein
MPKKLTKIELQKRLDRAAVARVRRLIELHPEMFDYGDIPPCRPLNPIQEAKMDAMRPQWAKDLIGGSTGSAEDTGLAASNADDAQLVFPGFQ